VLGIGGGGDVVGALAAARHCQRHGCDVVLGGVAWERMPIDPHPGPRSVGEIVGARPLSDCVVLAGPETRTADGATFAEAHMARMRGEETVLLDITGGPQKIASGLSDAALALDSDLIIGVDVGGDVLGEGSEPGLASPLCDAVMLAAADLLAKQGITTVGAVFGPCCDGELTLEELLDRLAALAAGGALLGTRGMDAAIVDELERAVAQIPTEASAQAIRCARGETGTTTIRSGRRTVMLSPIGALTFYFDPPTALATVAVLAKAVEDAQDLESANDTLHEIGVATELDFERSWIAQ
jgi:hypothetical protein